MNNIDQVLFDDFINDLNNFKEKILRDKPINLLEKKNKLIYSINGCGIAFYFKLYKNLFDDFEIELNNNYNNYYVKLGIDDLKNNKIIWSNEKFKIINLDLNNNFNLLYQDKFINLNESPVLIFENKYKTFSSQSIVLTDILNASKFIFTDLSYDNYIRNYNNSGTNSINVESIDFTIL
jgi:hypothetical protein